MKAFERLIRYAQIHTSSDDKSRTTPSSDRQRDLSLVLRDEMTALDFDGGYVDEHAYVYGFLPATAGRTRFPIPIFRGRMSVPGLSRIMTAVSCRWERAAGFCPPRCFLIWKT